MDKGNEKLARDLDILAAMAAEMPQYLDSEVLFWPLGRSGMPKLTLGGYLMREKRLLALQDQLSSEKQAQLEQATFQFNQAIADRVVRFEKKSQYELEARLRQWNEYLKDVDREAADRTSNYNTAVETRAMVDALMDRLGMPPYEMSERPADQLQLLDVKLQNRWKPGDFVWPESWESAYPRDPYWWLYGSPGGLG